MTTPYHVRLAVTQYGEQFRAELFTEDLGDTEGDLLPELPPSLGEWVPFLAQGAELPPDAARQLGKDLFSALLGQPENAKKWSEVLTQAERKGRPIRLLIDATTDSVRDLPYGLMCEPHDDWFLFRGGKKRPVAFVRILRRCSPRPLKLRDRLRVLLAVAEPVSADVPAFDAPLRLQNLCAALRGQVDVFLCGPEGTRPAATIASDPEHADPAIFAPFTRTTRESLRKALAGDFDVLHLLAHGHGAGLLLCEADGTPAESTASELAEWCSEGRTSLAFLQVCKAGASSGRGGFGGVAQQLLSPHGGNLAAVVASTFPLDAEYSTQAAADFYRQMAAGKPPEEALTADRPEADWCWAFLELWARPGALGGIEQRAAFQFVSPYRGLSSFGEQDSDLFFGRRSEVNELLQILRAEPTVVVVGDSGSGKSSLLQAGLVHAIRDGGLGGSEPWRIVSLRPGYRPAQSLLAELGDADCEATPESLRAALRTDSQPLVLIFDQLEELFTLARDRNEVQLLTAALGEAAGQHRDRFRLVIGMRSDFLGQAASVPGLSGLIRRPWVLRPPGTDNLRDIVAGPAEHCGYTFQGPLADGDPRHADGLLDRILADPLLATNSTTGERTAAPLPLLQFALERLWLKAVEKGLTEFTHAEFDEIGGTGKAVAQHAESVFQLSPTGTGLGPPARPLVEKIVTALVSPQGTRQPRVRADLQAENSHPEDARAVVDYLVGERLLTVRSDPEDLSKSLVDLSHEALIQHWDRLRGWLAEDPKGRAMREEFRKAAEQWDTGVVGGHPRSRLGLPGADVATNYLAWVRTSQPRLSPLQQEFAAELQAMLTRQRRVRRAVMTSLGGLAVAASLLAIYARGQANIARDLEGKANVSAAEAKASEGKARESEKAARASEGKARERLAALTLDEGIRLCEQGRPRIGMLSIAESLRLCPEDSTELRRVIRMNLAGWAPLVMCLDEARRLPGPVTGASADGEVALIQVKSGWLRAVDSLQLVSVSTGEPVGPVFTPDPRNGLWAHVIRKDRDWWAFVYGSRKAQLWNATTGLALGKVIDATGSDPDREIFVANLSPDGQVAAIGLTRGGVRLWDSLKGKCLGAPLPHEGRVNDLQFFPDGKLLLTGCERPPDIPLIVAGKKQPTEEAEKHAGGITRLWRLSDRTVLRRWWQRDPVTFVGVSGRPPGKYVMFGGFDVVVTDWEANTPIGQHIREPEPGYWGVFDPAEEGKFLIARLSGHVDVYHALAARRSIGERLSSQGWLAGAGFRTRDNSLFTLNGDGTVRIWRPPLKSKPREYLHKSSVYSVAFGPMSETIATACRDGAVYYWSAADPGQPLQKLVPPRRPGEKPLPITQVHFSRDGTRIIAHDLHCHVFIWELPTFRLVTLPPGETIVGTAEDGDTVLVQLADNRFCLKHLRAKTAGTPFELPGGLGPDPAAAVDDDDMLRVRRVAFSPDRNLLAVIIWDGRAELRRAETGERIGFPITHLIYNRVEAIRAVEFSPDGLRLLARSNHARSICLTTTLEAENIYANRVGVQVSQFSPCGRLVLSATNFTMAQTWDVAKKEHRPVALLHNSQVWGITTSPNCDRVATASYDHTARAWDAVTGKPLSPPLFHSAGVSDVKYSHDGSHILTGSWDHYARLWPTDQEVPDDVERVRAWVETMTGLKIGVTGSSELLTAEEWNERKKQLDAMGGPPWTSVKPKEK